MSDARPERWIVVLAHGSADPRWRSPFEQLCAELAARTEAGVALAYLQFVEPTLEQVLGRVVRAGGRRAVVVPAFMSGGGHLLRDVQQTVAAAAASSGIDVRLTGALGEERELRIAMVEAMLRLGGG